MNKFIQAIKDINLSTVEELIQRDPKWINWCEDDGKNALHYLCGVPVLTDAVKAKASLHILKLLIREGMDINAVHRIKDACGFFPASPLWYAYTRGRNKTLFAYLLKNGANPNHCMFAIAWYDDDKAAILFKKYGAVIDDGSNGDTPFLAAFTWKKFKVAEWFLKNGANVNFADNKGNTALFYAVKRKYEMERIQLLLQYGAHPAIENKEGISPQKFAELNRQRKILQVFINNKSMTSRQ